MRRTKFVVPLFIAALIATTLGSKNIVESTEVQAEEVVEAQEEVPGFTGFKEAEDGMHQLYFYYEDGEQADSTPALVYGYVDGMETLWYVTNGAAMETYTGFTEGISGAHYFIENGHVSFATSGFIYGTLNGVEGYWYVRNGIAQTGFTGFLDGSVPLYGGGTWYLENGRIMAEYNGLAHGTINGEEADWYVENGAASLSTNDTVDIGGTTYVITNGKAEEYVPPVEEKHEETAEEATQKAASDTDSNNESVDTASSDSVTPEPSATVVPDEISYITTGIPTNCWGSGGYMGRITVPSTGINVGLYYQTTSDSENQSICDAADSAVFMNNGVPYIGDHVNQAFASLKNISVGSWMYITTSSGTYRYVCTETGTGSCSGSDIVLADGSTGQSRSAGSIIFYTCKGWPTVNYVVWYPN